MNIYGGNVIPIEVGSILHLADKRAALEAEVLIYHLTNTHTHTEIHSHRVTDPVTVVVITVAGVPQTETSV